VLLFKGLRTKSKGLRVEPIPEDLRPTIHRTFKEQNNSNCCTEYVSHYIGQLGASCWKVNLDQFNRKAYTTTNDNRYKKESINREGFSLPKVGREKDSEGDKTQDIGQDIH